MAGTLIKITTGGRVFEVTVKDSRPDLKLMQALIGGYIEPVKVRYMGVVREAYVDEDGLSKTLRRNDKATELVSAYYNPGDEPARMVNDIVGDMLVWVPKSRSK